MSPNSIERLDIFLAAIRGACVSHNYAPAVLVCYSLDEDDGQLAIIRIPTATDENVAEALAEALAEHLLKTGVRP